MSGPAGVLPALALGALSALAAAACEPEYDHVDVELTSSPPTATTVNGREIEITSGVAVVVRAAPVSGSGSPYDDSVEISLTSADTDVLAVLPGQAADEFALVGVWPGETRVIVSVDGAVRDHIPFTCTAYGGGIAP